MVVLEVDHETSITLVAVKVINTQAFTNTTNAAFVTVVLFLSFVVVP
jgi:hypothetical protein